MGVCLGKNGCVLVCLLFPISREPEFQDLCDFRHDFALNPVYSLLLISFVFSLFTSIRKTLRKANESSEDTRCRSFRRLPSPFPFKKVKFRRRHCDQKFLEIGSDVGRHHQKDPRKDRAGISRRDKFAPLQSGRRTILFRVSCHIFASPLLTCA